MGTDEYSQSENRRFFKTINTPNGIPVDKEETCIPKQNNCPGCGDIYKEPVIEDQIMCGKCSEWWHKACMSYEGTGNYICDHC
jgi:hypothetical protein